MRRLLVVAALYFQAAAAVALQAQGIPEPSTPSSRVGRLGTGDRTIPAGTTVQGPIAVANGTLEVRGRIVGSAFTLGGDVIVRPGGIVTGDAYTLGGNVRVEGGEVQRSPSTAPFLRQPRPEVAPPASAGRAVTLVLGWFAVLALLGLVSLFAAERNVEAVVDELETRFTRAFWLGVATELAILPVGLLVLAGLALTVVGILLIPFAIVAYAIAVLGVVALGFVAVARVVGGGVVGVTGRDARSRRLRALVVGVVLLIVAWLAAALLTPFPLAAVMVRAVALAITWVAVTLGLGAAVASRAGAGRQRAAIAEPARSPDPRGWQTPTPVTGVVAARRPTATPTVGAANRG